MDELRALTFFMSPLETSASDDTGRKPGLQDLSVSLAGRHDVLELHSFTNWTLHLLPAEFPSFQKILLELQNHYVARFLVNVVRESKINPLAKFISSLLGCELFLAWIH